MLRRWMKVSRFVWMIRGLRWWLAGLVVLAIGGLAGQADAFVYWDSQGPVGPGGAIGRANLDGSGVNESFISMGTNVPLGVAVDGQHIYWANNDGTTVGRANLDGSGVTKSFISGASTQAGVAVNAHHIYWTRCYDRRAV